MSKWTTERLLTELSRRSINEPEAIMGRNGKPKRTSNRAQVALIALDVSSNNVVIPNTQDTSVTNNIRDHESESNIEPVVLDVQESVLDKDLMDLDVRLDQKRKKLMNLEANLSLKKAKEQELCELDDKIKSLSDTVDMTIWDEDKKDLNHTNKDTGKADSNINYNSFVNGMSKEGSDKNQVSHMGRLVICIINKNEKWNYLYKIRIACMYMEESREKCIFGANEISVMVDLGSFPQIIWKSHVDARKCSNEDFDGRMMF
jgi:hypothetical protein